MTEYNLMIWALLTGLLSALATGLGALVALFMRGESPRMRAFTNAFAAGMMISASVYALVHEALELVESAQLGMLLVVGGMLLGAGFFSVLSDRLEHKEPGESNMLTLDRASLLVFLALFIHSIPEGVAIGVGFATGDVTFGLMMTGVIAAHNVPEGIAMTLPMRARGEPIWRCALVAVLTSLPQPLLAVPALIFFRDLQPMLPVGLGFASGAMLYLVVRELLPEALEASEPGTAAWGVTLGICAMLLLGVPLM